MKTAWPLLSLGQVAEIVGGSTPRRDRPEYWGGTILWVTPTDLPMPGQGIAKVETTAERISVEGLESSSIHMLPVGTVLFSSRATIGKLGVAQIPLATNQGFANFIPKAFIDGNYLAYCLQFNTDHITALAGSTTFKEVNKSALKQYRIPVPPISEQRRIVEILNQADAIRKKRAEADVKADRILSLLFYNMFGDPVVNSMEWPRKRIEDLGLLVTKGESPRWQGFGYLDAGIRFITSENVLVGKLDLAKAKFVSEEFHQKLNRSQLQSEDILINIVGASIGRACIVTEEALPANVNQAVAIVRLSPLQSIPYFILAQLLMPSMQQVILGNRVEAARANISLTDIRELSVILPPIEKQRQFVLSANRIELVRTSASSSTRNLKQTFEMLLHRAFSSDLTAKWREAHMKELLAEVEQQSRVLNELGSTS